MSWIFFCQVNSSGTSDFCIRNIKLSDFGRREIDIAEQGKGYCLFSSFRYMLKVIKRATRLVLWMAYLIGSKLAIKTTEQCQMVTF